ncbi:MAG: hypothetical protein PPP56_10700 [Longimonas sp.]|uniref:hypothetical protein n=1 Tax=Longimonas sp. TaxID=2039626 RepID=UPI003349B956
MALTPAPATAQAQTPRTVAPSVQDVRVHIQRGTDVVQPPSLWYQEGLSEPDSLGIIRIPRGPREPGSITFRDSRGGFDANLQHATLTRDGEIVEVIIPESVLRGERSARFIVRPPDDDFYDVAYPTGTTSIEEIPGEQTVIDVYDWYHASDTRVLAQVNASEMPGDIFASTELAYGEDDRPRMELPLTRTVQGVLQSTAPGGERVRFYLTIRKEAPVARPAPRSMAMFQPVSLDRSLPPMTRQQFVYRDRPRSARMEWITRVGFTAGPNRATLPRNQNQDYRAQRIRGDIQTQMRWHTSDDLWLQIGLLAATQPTLGLNDQNHHDVPYGLQAATRIGNRNGFLIMADAVLEDSPFQQQSMSKSDQRLRMLMGLDVEGTRGSYRILAGPTYFRDQPAIFETRTDDTRQLGIGALANWVRPFDLGSAPLVADLWVRGDRSWGFIADSGSANTSGMTRLALRYHFELGVSSLEIGPVLLGQYHQTTFETRPGLTDWSLLGGIELKTNVRLFGGI